MIESIPADLEVIVQIAFRVRRDQYAQNHGTFLRFRVRTPEEIEAAAEGVHETLWNGTLETLRLLNGKGEPRATA